MHLLDVIQFLPLQALGRIEYIGEMEIQNEAPQPGPNPGSATFRKHDSCVIFTELF